LALCEPAAPEDHPHCVVPQQASLRTHDVSREPIEDGLPACALLLDVVGVFRVEGFANGHAIFARDELHDHGAVSVITYSMTRYGSTRV
jgi:hypothetical protein